MFIKGQLADGSVGAGWAKMASLTPLVASAGYQLEISFLTDSHPQGS